MKTLSCPHYFPSATSSILTEHPVQLCEELQSATILGIRVVNGKYCWMTTTYNTGKDGRITGRQQEKLYMLAIPSKLETVREATNSNNQKESIL